MKLKRNLLITAIVLVLVFSAVRLAMYPTAVRAPSMMARLVDGTTGQPISGARVTSRANLEVSFSMCGGERKEIYSYHTVTDNDGYFVVPAWGPKPVPSGWGVESFSPWVEFEKDGYQLGSDWQSFSGGSDTRPSIMACLSGVALMSSSWDHRKLLLYKNGAFPRGAHSDVIPLDKPVGYIVFAGE